MFGLLAAELADKFHKVIGLNLKINLLQKKKEISDHKAGLSIHILTIVFRSEPLGFSENWITLPLLSIFTSPNSEARLPSKII